MAGPLTSFLVPASHLTPAEIKVYRDSAISALIDLMIKDGLVQSADAVAVRDGLPNSDFGLVPVLGAGDEWFTPALVFNTPNNIIAMAAGLPTNRYVAVLGVFSRDAGPGITRLDLSIGTATRLCRVEVEPLYALLETIAFLSEPIIFKPTDIMTVTVLPRLANAAGERFGLLTLVVEPSGQTVARRS